MRDLRTTTPRATTARTATLAAAALGLLLSTTACGSDSSSTGRDTAAPVAQVGTATPTPATTPTPTTTPTTPAPAEGPALADGEYAVQVLSAGADRVGIDVGRFVVGEPLEPGVDSTAPITFDTGAAEEDEDIPLDGDVRLTLHVAGSGATQVTAADLAAAVEASAGPFLATVEVSGGEVVSLEELYRA